MGQARHKPEYCEQGGCTEDQNPVNDRSIVRSRAIGFAFYPRAHVFVFYSVAFAFTMGSITPRRVLAFGRGGQSNGDCASGHA